MKYFVGAVFAVAVIAFAIAAIRGRVRARNCCTPVAPENDARLQP